MLAGHPQAILDVRQIDGDLNAMAWHGTREHDPLD